MAHLTWAEAKEIVEISLELDYSNPDIVKELRMRSGISLLDAIQKLLGLLAVADHPKAEERYERMRTNITRCNTAPAWSLARMKLRNNMPTRELL